jgi:hypothetical protein
MRTWIVPASVLVLAVLASESRGNTRVREPPPPVRRTVMLGEKETKLIVKVDESARGALLRLPDTLVASVEQLPQGDPRGSGMGLPGVVSAVALTLAFVSGGLWLVRRGKAGRAALVLLLGLGIGIGCGPQATNNPAPDGKGPDRPHITVLTLPATVTLAEDLTLAIDDSRWVPEAWLIVGPTAVETDEGSKK